MVLTILVLGGGRWPQPAVASHHHAAQALHRLRMNPEEVSEPDDDAPMVEEDQPEVPAERVDDQSHVPESEGLISTPSIQNAASDNRNPGAERPCTLNTRFDFGIANTKILQTVRKFSQALRSY